MYIYKVDFLLHVIADFLLWELIDNLWSRPSLLVVQYNVPRLFYDENENSESLQ